MNNEAPEPDIYDAVAELREHGYKSIWIRPVGHGSVWSPTKLHHNDIEYRRVDPPAAPEERDKAPAHELADCASKCDREGFETLIVRALATVRAEGEKAAFKDCITELCIDCAEGDEPAFDAQAKWYYHEVGTKMEVGCSASKLRIRVAALQSARTGKVEW